MAWLTAIVGVIGGLLKAAASFFGWKQQRELVDAGRAAERADRAEADLAVAKRQGEIMAEQRTREDVAKRLRDGSF